MNFACAGQLIFTALIWAVKLPSTALIRAIKLPSTVTQYYRFDLAYFF